MFSLFGKHEKTLFSVKTLFSSQKGKVFMTASAQKRHFSKETFLIKDLVTDAGKPLKKVVSLPEKHSWSKRDVSQKRRFSDPANTPVQARLNLVSQDQISSSSPEAPLLAPRSISGI